MPWWKKYVLRNETGEGGEGGGGFNMEAAVNSIGADLGFSTSDDKGDDNVEGNEGTPSPAPPPPQSTPAPSPAPTPAPSPAPAPTPAPAPSPAPGPAPAPAPGSPPVRFTADAPPTTWSRAASEQWAAIPASVREEIAKRENDMFRGLAEYREGATFHREVDKVLTPLKTAFQQHGIQPLQFIDNLTKTHLTLADTNTPVERRVEFAKELLKSYGLDLTAKPGETPPYVDPEVASLRETVHRLESRLNGAETTAETQRREKLAAELKAFADDPANPYFYDVADDMALLIRGSGGAMGHKEAYEKAVRANPVIYAKEVARLQKEAVDKANKEAAEAAEAARKKTESRVKTNGHQGSGTGASGSMEDTMAETLASIRARERK